MKASDATGQTERLGTLGPKAKEEWWYPLYMKEKCPGLPNWEALKDPKCAEAFSTAETAPKGRYLGGPVTWEGFDDERVEALGLPFTVIHAGTDAAMFAELDSAYQRKAPIMLWIYSPHWAPAKYEGEWVEFPEYTRRNATPIRNGASIPTRPMIAASPWRNLEIFLGRHEGQVAGRLQGRQGLSDRHQGAEHDVRPGRSRWQDDRGRRSGLGRRQRGEMEGLGAIVSRHQGAGLSGDETSRR